MSNNEKNVKRVIEKMATAATELGWPEQVVPISELTEVQIKTMDQVMDAWEEQLKLPDHPLRSAAVNSRCLPNGAEQGGGERQHHPGEDNFPIWTSNWESMAAQRQLTRGHFEKSDAFLLPNLL